MNFGLGKIGSCQFKYSCLSVLATFSREPFIKFDVSHFCESRRGPTPMKNAHGITFSFHSTSSFCGFSSYLSQKLCNVVLIFDYSSCLGFLRLRFILLVSSPY